MPRYDTQNDQECRDHVLWSNHAIIRAVEYKIDISSLYYAWRTASDYRLPEKERAHKIKRYGEKALSDRFFYHAPTGILFTVHSSKSGQWFIETVTIKR